MNKIEAASPSSSRKVIDVQKLLGLPDSTPNPHLWYQPRTMPAVAQALVTDLSAIQPAHAAYFAANAQAFDSSLQPWYQALKQFATRYPRTPVAVTEPVGDYLLQAAGAMNHDPVHVPGRRHERRRPRAAERDPAERLFSGHQVKVFLYNQQVTDPLTQSFLATAGRTASRSSGCTRRCRRPATTTSPGCSPRSTRSRRPWPTAVSTERLQ